MSGWLKKTSRDIVLFHFSDAPYHLNKDYILLCGTNCLFEKEIDIHENSVSFYINRKLAKRRHANCWMLIEFPYKLPVGKIIKLKNKKMSIDVLSKNHRVHVAVVKNKYVKTLLDSQIVDLFSKYEKKFLLSKEADSGEKTRIANSLTTDHIICGNSWHVALLRILDHLCFDKHRNKDWCQNIPDAVFEIYGIKNSRELDLIHSIMDEFGISEKVEIIVR